MKKFAKLFELENGAQVLITIDTNDDKEVYVVCIRTDLEGGVARVKLEIEDEDETYQFLEDYTLEQAIQFHKQMSEQFN
jgi:hypothetical protein